MQYETSYRQIIRLAGPISLSLLIPQVSFMANAAFVGHLGTLPLDVNSLCGIFYLLLTWMGFGLSNGVMVIISRKLGANETGDASRSFGNAIILCLLISLCLATLTLLLAPLLFAASLHNRDVIAGCRTFISIRVTGLPFLMLTQLINVYFIATNRSRALIAGSVVGNGVNILLDYGLIFGHYGLPDLGLYGAAVASVCGEVLFCITMWGIFFLRKEHLRFQVFKYLRLHKPVVLHIFKISAPLVFQYIFSIGGWLLFFIYVEHLGKTQLAASHIIRSVLGITGIGTWALASTCNTMVSNIIGQGKSRSVLLLVRKILLVSFAYALVFCLVLNVFPVPFLSIYTQDAAVIKMAAPTLRLMSCSILVLSLGTICFNAVVGSGKTWVNMAIEIFCVCSYMAYVTIVVEKLRLSLPVAWSSEFVYWTLLFLLSGAYLLKKFHLKES